MGDDDVKNTWLLFYDEGRKIKYRIKLSIKKSKNREREREIEREREKYFQDDYEREKYFIDYKKEGENVRE